MGVHQLHADATADAQVAGGDGQIDVGAEDARGTDHQVEAPAEAQRLDQGLMRRDPRNTPPQVGQHAGMRIHSLEFNPFAEKTVPLPGKRVAVIQQENISSNLAAADKPILLPPARQSPPRPGP